MVLHRFDSQYMRYSWISIDNSHIWTTCTSEGQIIRRKNQATFWHYVFNFTKIDLLSMFWKALLFFKKKHLNFRRFRRLKLLVGSILTWTPMLYIIWGDKMVMTCNLARAFEKLLNFSSTVSHSVVAYKKRYIWSDEESLTREQVRS